MLMEMWLLRLFSMHDRNHSCAGQRPRSYLLQDTSPDRPDCSPADRGESKHCLVVKKKAERVYRNIHEEARVCQKYVYASLITKQSHMSTFAWKSL